MYLHLLVASMVWNNITHAFATMWSGDEASDNHGSQHLPHSSSPSLSAIFSIEKWTLVLVARVPRILLHGLYLICGDRAAMLPSYNGPFFTTLHVCAYAYLINCGIWFRASLFASVQANWLRAVTKTVIFCLHNILPRSVEISFPTVGLLSRSTENVMFTILLGRAQKRRGTSIVPKV